MSLFERFMQSRRSARERPPTLPPDVDVWLALPPIKRFVTSMASLPTLPEPLPNQLTAVADAVDAASESSAQPSTPDPSGRPPWVWHVTTVLLCAVWLFCVAVTMQHCNKDVAKWNVAVPRNGVKGARHLVPNGHG